MKENIANPAECAGIIKKHNFRFKKKYGQNFLIDSNILSAISEISGTAKDSCVIEIGPGIGSLTQVLCENAGFVIAVEIDKELIPILNETLSDYDNKLILNEDIMKTDLNLLAEKYNEGKPFKVVANLPYYITTPIVMELLKREIPVSDITIMVQKEVAKRMIAKAGTPDYGALSLAVAYRAEASIEKIVSKNCFMPQPQVESAVVHLKKYHNPPVKVKDEELMLNLIKAAFSQRRKMLYNTIVSYPKFSFSKDEVISALTEMNLSCKIRGENLSIEEYAVLADKLYDA